MEIKTSSEQETKSLAEKISKNLVPGNVLALYGDLGTGKTTFTRYLVEMLGFNSRVQSPTYVLHRKYHLDPCKVGENIISEVNHFDLYRLQASTDIGDLDLTEYFAQVNSITIIEWPELVEYLLPKDSIAINFKLGENLNERIINVQDLR